MDLKYVISMEEAECIIAEHLKQQGYSLSNFVDVGNSHVMWSDLDNAFIAFDDRDVPVTKGGLPNGPQ